MDVKLKCLIDEKVALKMLERKNRIKNPTLAEIERKIRERTDYDPNGQRGVPKPGVSVKEFRELHRLRDVASNAAYRFYLGQVVSIADYLDAMIDAGGVVEKHYRGFKIVFNGGSEYYPVTDKIGIAYLREFYYCPSKEE